MPQSKTSGRKALALERELRALELRKAGASYAQIAEVLGISRSAAHKAVARALDKVIAEVRENADRLRALELERLDHLSRELWRQALKGHLGAIDRLLKVMERRAKLLGLDAPTKADIQGEQVIRIIEEVSEDDT